MTRKAQAEKALALIRQGHPNQAIDVLEHLIANWESTPTSHSLEPSGLELDRPSPPPIPDVPKFTISEDGKTLSVEEGWTIGESYLAKMTERLRRLRKKGFDLVLLEETTWKMLQIGAVAGKVKREG